MSRATQETLQDAAGTFDASEMFDAVIVGSGFGGSISALRLAEAGKTVLVLERGKRYRAGEFPRDVRDADSLFWRYPKRRDGRGLYDVRFFSGIAAVVASGVGGGSLIYANIHIRPDATVFDDPRWTDSITRQTLDPYFDKVAAMLNLAPLPVEIDLPKRNLYRRAAQHLGREVFDPDMAVRWRDDEAAIENTQHSENEQRKEIDLNKNDRSANGYSENDHSKACRFVAECEFGCQYGAKNSMDVTYLALAEKLGARVAPECLVTGIEPDAEGYTVHYEDVATAERRKVKGRRVVLAAGTLGTNEILLRCRDDARTLPKLSPRLGYGYSGNGDFLGSIQNSREDLQPWKGTDVTSVIKFFDRAPEFTMAAPTFNQPVMNVLASFGQRRGTLLRLLAPFVWGRLETLVPWAFAKGLLSQPSRLPAPHAGDASRMTNLFAIGRDNANGVINLKANRLDIHWDYAKENEQLINRMTDAMREVGDFYGGTFAPLISWNVFKRIITVHSLGGCHLSDTPERGVVSTRGEVHNYPGLFIADGSVVPTAIGFHPVMTICALAERIAEAVVDSYEKR